MWHVLSPFTTHPTSMACLFNPLLASEIRWNTTQSPGRQCEPHENRWQGHDHPCSGDIVPTMCTYSPLKNRFEVEIMGLMQRGKDDDCRVMSWLSCDGILLLCLVLSLARWSWKKNHKTTGFFSREIMLTKMANPISAESSWLAQKYICRNILPLFRNEGVTLEKMTSTV